MQQGCKQACFACIKFTFSCDSLVIEKAKIMMMFQSALSTLLHYEFFFYFSSSCLHYQLLSSFHYLKRPARHWSRPPFTHHTFRHNLPAHNPSSPLYINKYYHININKEEHEQYLQLALSTQPGPERWSFSKVVSKLPSSDDRFKKFFSNFGPNGILWLNHSHFQEMEFSLKPSQSQEQINQARKL